MPRHVRNNIRDATNCATTNVATIKKVLTNSIKICYYTNVNNKGGITMNIARFTLITFVTFAFLMGCGMIGKQAEMPEDTTMAAEEKPMDKLTVPTPKKAAYQEVTFQVEGMT